MNVISDKKGQQRHEWGTGGSVTPFCLTGQLPVKNYATNLFPEHEKMDGRYLRTHFEVKRKPCWACHMNHCSYARVTEGPYEGYEGEEPEYECITA